jgi:SAM-dependent methyltransferase
MSTPIDFATCRRLYAEKIKPIFAGQPQSPSLDDRNEFYLRMLADQGLLEPGRHLVDLGAGLSIFGPICRAYGLEVSLVDDFGGGGGVLLGQRLEEIKILDVFEKQLGLRIVRENFLEHPLPFPDASADVVTCFHSLEHWHHSPKRLFREIVRVLKPHGCLLIVTPNAVNIRKRIYVIFGRNNFPDLREWYHNGDPVFRGHIREPVIRDLHQLMQWNGFQVVATRGRNFIGRESKALAFLPRPLVSAVAISSDWLLRFFPSLCSDIHVMGRKSE